MKQVIHKYKLRLGLELQTVAIPAGATILSVQMQGNDLCLWALVDTDLATKERSFLILGTENPIPDHYKMSSLVHVGTVQQDRFVLHVFTTLDEWIGL